MSKFGNIFLSWRKGPGSPRHLVGIIKSNVNQGVTFQYLPSAKLSLAEKDGFDKYTEFQDKDKVYTSGVLEVFKQRLFKSERSDYKDFLSFWGIDEKYKDDTLHLLAHTHGMIPTDNFEFLADFHLTKDLKFVSEIAGLTHLKPSSASVIVDDELIWKKNPTKEDRYQVDVFTKKGDPLGWIKKVHSKIFYKINSNQLKIKVKAIDKNGVLKRIFVEIYL